MALKASTQKVLVLGSGSREHALSWKLAQEEIVSHVYVCPGNGGTHSTKISSINLPINHIEGYIHISEFAHKNGIDLVVIGPEEPLCNGISDVLRSQGIACFGPSMSAARLEGSKSYSKELMSKYNIPTARYKTFRGYEQFSQAIDYLTSNWNTTKCVIKASGLASGKGVVVPDTLEEGIEAVKENLLEKKFGLASQEIVIEEKLEGKEVSLFILSNGEDFIPLPACHDYKRLKTNDEGPNTGGMGAVCPSPRISKQTYDEVIEKIIKPTLRGMNEQGNSFIGCLYTGLILTSHGPKVLEYNVRFGDPETQSLLASLNNNLYSTLLNCALSKPLDKQALFSDYQAVSVVMASEGYPEKPVKGILLKGFEYLDASPSILLFHGSTFEKNSDYYTSGGRVLTVTARSDSLKKSTKLVYSSIPKLLWDKCQFRTDIGIN